MKSYIVSVNIGGKEIGTQEIGSQTIVSREVLVKDFEIKADFMRVDANGNLLFYNDLSQDPSSCLSVGTWLMAGDSQHIQELVASWFDKEDEQEE